MGTPGASGAAIFVPVIGVLIDCAASPLLQELKLAGQHVLGVAPPFPRRLFSFELFNLYVAPHPNL